MLSAKTRKTIEYINSFGSANSVALSTDSFLGEVIDIAALLRRPDLCISLRNGSGDTIYIYPGKVSLQASGYVDGFANGEYSTIYPVILEEGNLQTPHITNLSYMLNIFNERHTYKVSLSKILKVNIEQLYLQLKS